MPIKPWYRSQTILCILAALVVQLARRLGIEIIPADAQDIALVLLDLGSAMFAGFAIHGRVVATGPISKGRGGKAPLGPLAAIALMILLAAAGPIACASVEARTPAQRVYAIESDLLLPLATAKAYVERADADPDTKATIKRLVAGIDNAVNSAQTAVRAGDSPTIPAAIAAATTAAGELLAYLKQRGIL